MLFAMVKGEDSSEVNAEPSAEVGTQPMGGMMRMMGRTDNLQEIMNSAAALAEIRFVALLDQKGVIRLS